MPFTSPLVSLFRLQRYPQTAARSLMPFRARRAVSAVGISLLAMLSWTAPGVAQAQEKPISSSVIFNAPPPPPGQGSPSGRRDGGASRGDCPEYSDLAALVPVVEGKVWGQTTAAQPVLWFSLPAALTSEISIELAVQDAEDNFLYEERLTGETEDAGIIAITLPETVTLPTDEPHYWTMALYCDSARETAAVFVNGTIERVVTSDLEPLTTETVRSLSTVQAYAEAGIWHDALTILAELRQADEGDPDIQAAWSALLEQAELAEIAAAPIQPCCKAE